MKYAIGFAAGLATAWAALAIWSHIPPFPDLDAPLGRPSDDMVEWVGRSSRPGYRDSIAH